MSEDTKQEERTQNGFMELGVSASILEVLRKLNIETPTPIQIKAIPAASLGQDLIGVAQTGTGKTYAFGIPMIERLEAMKGRGLILLPTRELAFQVEENLRQLGSLLGLRTAALIGGEPIGKQVYAIRRDPHIIVATPGRLIDHLKRNFIRLGEVKILVLDEADMMLDMGFAPQLEEILKQVPKDRQTMLFSATMPQAIVKIATTHMKLPVHIEVAPAGTTAEKVDQEMYILKKEDKIIHLEKILKEYTGSVLVFTRTKHGAKALTCNLQAMGHKTAEIHSNLSLGQRREALAGFKSKKYRILVATDIAARGIDVSGIELVVNYDLPDDTSDYVHRIGRTGRAGEKGKAISFATTSQGKDIRNIERLINKNLSLKKFAELDRAPVRPMTSRFGRRTSYAPKYGKGIGSRNKSGRRG